MLTVYLGGPINGRTDAECKDWRAMVTEALAGRMNVRDPMVRDYRGKEDESVEAIVEGDKNDMRASDILLFNCLLGPSYGTAMEVMFGHQWFQPVVAVATGRVSPWLRYHASCVVPTMADAVSVLLACSERKVYYDRGMRDLRWLDGSARVDAAPTPSRPEKE
jgi:hypothetical protein